MEGQSKWPVIKAINKAVAHRICSGQVILDLSSAVKELVENSLDAGASNIEIILKEYGEEFFKVIDNGSGISPDNFQALARKHHTSKIMEFSDLHSLTTFGFRGEALSSLCALGNVTVETRSKNEALGTHLTFDHSGSVIEEKKTARQVGTSVIVEKLFCSLPVRNKEFSRNIRREYGKLTSLLNAYALMARGVRFLCTNITGKNSRSVVLKTQGNSSIKENVITVLGFNTFQCLEPLSLHLCESCTVEGFLSKPGYGSGRNMGDRQFFYINGRPVDMPKVSKLLNEVYRGSNSKQYPIAIMNFIMPTMSCDVNVSPDKRKVFISDEGSLLLLLRTEIEKMYAPHGCSYSINSSKNLSDEPALAFQDCKDVQNTQVTSSTLKSSSPEHKQLEKNSSFKQHVNNVSPMILQCCNQDTDQETGYSSDNDSPSGKDLSRSVCEITSQQLKSRDTVKTNANLDGQTHLRSKQSDTSSHSNLVQSSLNKFLAVSKRKHDDNCTMLSERTVLRDEKISCQIRKLNKEMNVSGSVRSFLSGLGDDLTKDEVDKSEMHHVANNVSNKVESPCSIPNKEHEQEEAALSSSETIVQASPSISLESKSGRISKACPPLEPCDLNNMIKPCSGPKYYSVVQFSVCDVRKRRNKRISRLSQAKSTVNRSQRCFSAATLSNVQIENIEGKEDSLAAAAIELARFFRKEDFRRMEVIGQFNLGFIIGKLDQDLFIVDQHAADEKYNFERLSQSTVLNLQPLLKPLRLELSPEEEVVASMNMEIIRKNGFVLMEDTHAPSGHHFLLKAVPFSKSMTFGAEDLKELIATLADSQGECSIVSSYKMDTADSICPSRVRAMFASRACRTSVMIGDPLTKSEMQKILDNLVDLRSPWNCPHGRPTMRHLVDLTTLQSRRLEDG
ncbi:DNA mismatch repair protein PMS1 [Apostasia shenzhenica]|uniref:DNA mismatch repair protein PMS1 n=1 Tax=Apostasia shenzhenica TaxID=1088818 RepID=A0A2I0AAZ4_9ASPA|nr:DNA mismatch repair protein PMS1 [Apostasia shenzhenica]